jgi:hypothetical protein
MAIQDVLARIAYLESERGDVLTVDGNDEMRASRR